jgi:hypothetical protein
VYMMGDAPIRAKEDPGEGKGILNMRMTWSAFQWAVEPANTDGCAWEVCGVCG